MQSAGRGFFENSSGEWKETKFGADVFDFILPQNSVEQKQSASSTSPQEVKKQIVHWTRVLRARKIK